MLEALDGIYCGPAPGPQDIWTQWNADPVVIAALAGMAFAARRSGAGGAAVLVLAVAFLSPLCALSSALFSARAVHHVLLVAVAAPLLAAAWPARRAQSPAFAFAVSTALLWAWHLPAAYDFALGNVAVYWAMQVTLLASAFAFWRAVLSPGAPAVGGFMFVTGAYVQMALLGAVLVFAPGALYAIHQTAPLAWGLMPLADQQLGGFVMWVPAGLPYAVAAALLARRAWTSARGLAA